MAKCSGVHVITACMDSSGTHPLYSKAYRPPQPKLLTLNPTPVHHTLNPEP